MSEEESGSRAIVDLLRREGLLDDEQLAYAVRIQGKMSGSRPLLSVVQELGYASEEQIKEVLKRNRIGVPFGALLVELGFLSAHDLRIALDIQAQEPDKKMKLGRVLVEHNFVEERKLTEILATQLGFELVEVRLADLDPKLLAKTDPSWMLQNELLPIRETDDGGTVVVFADPMNADHLEAAQGAFGDHVIPAIAPRSVLMSVLTKLDPRAKGPAGLEFDDVAIRSTVDSMMNAAIELGASDIHIEPLSDRVRVRFRTDGMLVQYKDFPIEVLKPMAIRVKVMCEADITEKRRHQDARLFYTVADQDLDMRVSIYVTVHGEKIVLRLLNRSRQVAALTNINMAPHTLDRFLYAGVGS